MSKSTFPSQKIKATWICGKGEAVVGDIVVSAAIATENAYYTSVTANTRR
jgi:hypothetical protein